VLLNKEADRTLLHSFPYSPSGQVCLLGHDNFVYILAMQVILKVQVEIVWKQVYCPM